MISDYPLKPKYKFEDAVFILIDFHIEPVTIASYRVRVSNPSGDGNTAVQETFYKFDGHGELEVEEARVFASENHALSFMKNDGMNRAIESGSGGSGIFAGGYNNAKTARSFGNWTDFGGWDLSTGRFRSEQYNILLSGTVSVASGNYILTGVGTNFLDEIGTGAVGSGAGKTILINGTETYSVSNGGVLSDTLLHLSSNASVTRSGVTIHRKYDTRETTELRGTASIAVGTKTITGSGTFFLTEAHVGDVLILDETESVTIASIASNTSMQTVDNALDDWSGAYMTRKDSGTVTFLTESEGEKTLVFDGANLMSCDLPESMRTKALFWETVRSADAETTIWIDGVAIGRPE